MFILLYGTLLQDLYLHHYIILDDPLKNYGPSFKPSGEVNLATHTGLTDWQYAVNETHSGDLELILISLFSQEVQAEFR